MVAGSEEERASFNIGYEDLLSLSGKDNGSVSLAPPPAKKTKRLSLKKAKKKG